MKTLVYFASGPLKEEYYNLPFDKIYLIDNCFKKNGKETIYKKGKVTCIGMDALKSVSLLKEEDVKIDYFIALNEGLYEGGGRYAINSDKFLGYVMPLLNDTYYHLMNKSYYNGGFGVSMDLPFVKVEIFPDDEAFLHYSIFSTANSHQRKRAKLFRMTKINDSTIINLDSNIKLRIKHDSIWNYIDELGLVVLSLSSSEQDKFFKKLPKVINILDRNYKEILAYCMQNKISEVGFTPWLRGDYNEFLKTLNSYKEVYPKKITLFHLNKNDFKKLKNHD